MNGISKTCVKPAQLHASVYAFVCCFVFGRAFDVSQLREDLLLKLENERSEEVAGLRAKQKQVGFPSLDAANEKGLALVVSRSNTLVLTQAFRVRRCEKNNYDVCC